MVDIFLHRVEPGDGFTIVCLFQAAENDRRYYIYLFYYFYCFQDDLELGKTARKCRSVTVVFRPI